MALAGFTGSGSGQQIPIRRCKPMLDIRGIQICNAWFSTFFADGQKDKTIDELSTTPFPACHGRQVIGCSEQARHSGHRKASFEVNTSAMKSGGRWPTVATGEIAADKGMQVCLRRTWAPAFRPP